MIADFFFVLFAVMAIGGATAMVFARNPLASLLYLVMAFFALSGIFVLLDAHFIAAVNLIVYAGAILVLFLFVIMLLGTEREEIGASIRWQMPVAILLSAGLVGELVFAALRSPGSDGVQPSVLPADFGSPASVGRLLFSEYLIPFEAVSILLLVAMVGTIILTFQKGGGSK